MKKIFLLGLLLCAATLITTNAAAQSGADALKTRTKSNQSNEKTAMDGNESSTIKIIAPENGKTFTADEFKKPLTFRWTMPAPKPQGQVTYRLKVWQLMQGQNVQQAMRNNTPIIEKDVLNATETTVSNVITGPCKPPYLCDFAGAVQVMDAGGNTIYTGIISRWALDPADGANLSFPSGIFPENNKIFKLEEAMRILQFRWTPLVPKPKEPVTYRLKVWQLMQGQNAAAAMRSNKPLIEKDVLDVTKAEVSQILTGPCKPPYLCDFIWMVEVISADGKVLTEKVPAEPSAFSIEKS